ncbi:MAG: hypothetical protein JSR18_00115 [Proteobacteria bacterium]|nr:hypothetical protein [Pseudomonadota bacterium]
MADEPRAPQLLDIARRALLELVPEVDARHHYTLRMVANAMAIAAREGAADDVAQLDVDAARWSAAIAASPDPLADDALRTALVALTRARLAIANPRVLG